MHTNITPFDIAPGDLLFFVLDGGFRVAGRAQGKAQYTSQLGTYVTIKSRTHGRTKVILGDTEVMYRAN